MTLIDIRSAFAIKPPALDFVLPGFVVGTVGILTSPGGAGKSILAMQLAAAVASPSANLLKLPIKAHGRVLYINLEDPSEVLKIRLHDLGLRLNEQAREEVAERVYLYSLLGQGANIENEIWRETLYQMLSTAQPRLVIVDTFSRFHSSDENSNAEMARVISLIEALASSVNAALLILHHSNKGLAIVGRGDEQQSARGASALVDNPRWQAFLYKMTKEEAVKLKVREEDRKLYVRFGASKQNYGPPLGECWFVKTDGGILLPHVF